MNTKPCPKCREPVDANAKRCPHCTAQIGVDPARLVLIAIITVLAFIVFGGIIVRAVGGGF